MKKWTLPTLPDLSGAEIISLDLETYDPTIKEFGPGVRRDGRILGIAVAVPHGGRWYIPFGHPEGPQYDEAVVKEWALTELCRPNQAKLGANLLYDLDYLAQWGVPVTGPFFDVLLAEPLLDENRFRYNLGSLAEQYLHEGKETVIVEQVCEIRGFKGDPRQHLYKLPSDIVAPYAEGDVDRPLRIFEQQKKLLKEDGLWDLFMLETRLVPLMLAMRRRGVRVDTVAAEKFLHEVTENAMQAQRAVNDIADFHVEIHAAASIKKAADALGIKYNLTRKGNPSFTGAFLQYQAGPFGLAIIEARKWDKLRGTFLRGHLGEDHVLNGRIHCEFNQLRGTDYGTVTGRFSSSNPNLQQIPKKDPTTAILRSFFKPEPGELWGRADYSQVEIRILAHYAQGYGADEIRAEFNKNPDTDYHSLCAEIAGIERKHAKAINFGVIYGMGAKKLSKDLGLSMTEGSALLQNYYLKLPFIKATTALATNTAASRSWIHTILGRRRRFNEWEPSDWNLSQEFRTVDEIDRRSATAVRDWMIEARKRYIAEHPTEREPRYGVKRAWTYRALNAVIQGSAADLFKQALVNIWESGVCDVLGAPLLLVHDEVDFSVPNTTEGKEAFDESVRLMETAVPFRVPIKVDAKLKKDWGTPLTKSEEAI